MNAAVALEAYTDTDWTEVERFIVKQADLRLVDQEFRSERDLLPYPEWGISFEAVDELFRKL